MPFTDEAEPAAFGELFKIGIGPSSSHTVGPMRAANAFIGGLAPVSDKVARIVATAFGSLAWTGKGHATDRALILGLAGLRPDEIDPDQADAVYRSILSDRRLVLPDRRGLAFDPDRDVVFDCVAHFDRHPNAMRFAAFDAAGVELKAEVWFSIGGGFVEREGGSDAPQQRARLPHAYRTADELLALCAATGRPIADVSLDNELARKPEAVCLGEIDRIAEAMFACIDRGLSMEGELSGGLGVRRRARHLHERIQTREAGNDRSPMVAMDYVSCFAIAVNEENAAGGRVVTAPTNGAAGVVPAVLRYFRDFCGGDQAGVRRFLLVAAAIGGLIKRNASISGAEVGCQGEVGSAAAMAAAGLCAALGGTDAQIENAAEIAIEHHLGMTCDPVGGLVQIPCIERNAFGAIKAINAASLALHGDGKHIVSLDAALETMRQTGLDMQSKYKETSLGGLAVNVTAC